MSKSVLEATEIAPSMRRTRHVAGVGQEGMWAYRMCRKSSRVFRTAKTLSTAPNTMGYTIGARRASALSKRMRYVKKPGQEANWTCRRHRGNVESNWDRQNDGDSVGYDGNDGRMDGATSDTCYESKRVETKSPTGNRVNQYEQYKRTTGEVLGQSKPPPNHPRSLTDYVNPPLRRG